MALDPEIRKLVSVKVDTAGKLLSSPPHVLLSASDHKEVIEKEGIKSVAHLITASMVDLPQHMRRRIRTDARAILNAFIKDFLNLEGIEDPLDALQTNVSLIRGMKDDHARRLWDRGVITIAMLAAQNVADHPRALSRFIRGARLIARSTEVPSLLRESLKKEFNPRNMEDVVMASPIYLKGVGKINARKLRRWGIENIGQLACQSPVEIAAALSLPMTKVHEIIGNARSATGEFRQMNVLMDAIEDLRSITERLPMVLEEAGISTYGEDISSLLYTVTGLLEDYLTLVNTWVKIHHT